MTLFRRFSMALLGALVVGVLMVALGQQARANFDSYELIGCRYTILYVPNDVNDLPATYELRVFNVDPFVGTPIPVYTDTVFVTVAAGFTLSFTIDDFTAGTNTSGELFYALQVYRTADGTTFLDSSTLILLYVTPEEQAIYTACASSGGTDNGQPPATLTPVPTDTPTATSTDRLTDTPTATSTDRPTDTPTATSTDGPTATPTATPTDGPTATPTNTPDPGMLPSPTPSATGTLAPGLSAPAAPCLHTIPAGSVVGSVPNGAQAYWSPGNVAPGLVLNPGTYWILGQDASESYYHVFIACRASLVWIRKDTAGPSFAPPWNGQALPTRVVQ